MNGKSARRLRKLIAQETSFLPEVCYEDVNRHTRWVPTGMLRLDGSPELVPFELYTRELGACQRALYQRSKRLHREYHQG